MTVNIDAQAALKALTSLSSARAARMSEGHRSSVRAVIPTGILPLDHYVLGCGGLAEGRIYEIHGPESSGKTSLTGHCAGRVQHAGGVVVLAETEEAFAADRYAQVGTDIEAARVLEVETVEGVCRSAQETLQVLRATGFEGPIFFAWDSLAATPTAAELAAGLTKSAIRELELERSARKTKKAKQKDSEDDDGDDGDDGVEVKDKKVRNSMDNRPRVLSSALRQLGQDFGRYRGIFWVVNQIRDNIGVKFGDPIITPGGRAIRFHATTRLRFYGQGTGVSEGGDIVGLVNKVWTVKNKLGPSKRWCQLRLNYGSGYDADWALLMHAKEAGVIEPRSFGPAALAKAREALGWG